jgi:hypothetical protein
MTTDIKLNTLIEWTAEDRAKGECPVPDGSDVTVWFLGGVAKRDCSPQHWDWDESDDIITAYLVHSVPREPIVRWLVVGGGYNGLLRVEEKCAVNTTKEYGGRVVKLVEEVE